MRLYPARHHRPLEVCADCGQLWPCVVERARSAGARDAWVAVARATEAALAKIEERTEGGVAK